MTEYKHKILLVEDDKNIARLIKYNLDKGGYDVQHGINGAIGFELVKSFQPDVIISDIMMPEVDGFAFRKMLINSPEFKSIPFIFLTAKGEEDDMLQAYDLDIQDYIVKTASPKIILAKLKSIISSSAVQKAQGETEIKAAAAAMGAQVVPDNVPEFTGYKITQLHKPFKDIPGGDFIDYVKINEEIMVVVLGDVMGKKWGAWYFAVAYAGYVRSAIRSTINESTNIIASDIVQRVNEAVFNDERISDVFVTLSILVLDRNKGTIGYCGAGDIPLFHLSNGKVGLIKSEGTLLGFSKDGNYETVDITLLNNDEIFVITDGIIESRDIKGESIENERLIDIILKKGENDSLQFIESSVSKLTNNIFEDDTTIICIQKKD
ncbi:MAG: fused response regulator/phosphatase [Melioribacteraceae bacterium]|jgi:sigma-B regulation protein RsbU (phosphoserine phosphatase)|nr:fused response regulator/phosphatase [Melioribacteraceae bacterium]